MPSNNGFFWARLMTGLVLVWTMFQWIALQLGSVRGEAGLVVAAVVVATLFATERLLFRTPVLAAAASLGLGRPRFRSLGYAAAIASLMLLYFPTYTAFSGESLRLSHAWAALALGQFAQGGLAEEALFRGYLFRRIRERHPFWRAAWLSMLPFVAVHLMLFFTLPVEIASASLLLSIVTSFPLARLFDLGGGNVGARPGSRRHPEH